MKKRKKLPAPLTLEYYTLATVSKIDKITIPVRDSTRRFSFSIFFFPIYSILQLSMGPYFENMEGFL
jgi:hypothetical protein